MGNWWQTSAWLAIPLAMVGALASGIFTKEPSRPPAKIRPAPTFTLRDQRGTSFGSDNLRGKAWVANFIFTRCVQSCPRFSADMAKLSRRTRHLGGSVHLVSFSIDPEHDTPQVLAQYGERFGAEPARWSFLTGPTDDIQSVVMEGMKIFIEAGGQADNPASILHGEYFVLIDQEGIIRDYYDLKDEGSLNAILHDLDLVLREHESTERAAAPSSEMMPDV